MKGSMRPGKRTGTWELRVYIGRDPVSKQPRQVSRTFEGTKRGAQTALANLITETSEGKHGGSNATVGQLLDEWLKTSGKVTGSTHATYERVADLLKSTSLSLVKLSQLGSHDIEVAYNELGRRIPPPSDHTMVQVHRYLGTAIRKGMDWGWIKSNPQAVRSLRPHKPAVEPKVATAVEVIALVEQAAKTDPDLAATILLAAKTGLRRGELAALTFGDIDGNVLTVRRSHSIVKGKVVDGPPKMRKESDEPESIRLTDDCVLAVRAVRQRQFDLAESLGAELPPNGFVLSSDGMGNTPRRPDRLGREIRATGAAIGIDASPHRLRHFMASDLTRDGADIASVAKRMRHRDKALTLRTYVHDDGSQDTALAEMLDRSLTRKDPP